MKNSLSTRIAIAAAWAIALVAQIASRQFMLVALTAAGLIYSVGDLL